MVNSCFLSTNHVLPLFHDIFYGIQYIELRGYFHALFHEIGIFQQHDGNCVLSYHHNCQLLRTSHKYIRHALKLYAVFPPILVIKDILYTFCYIVLLSLLHISNNKLMIFCPFFSLSENGLCYLLNIRYIYLFSY